MVPSRGQEEFVYRESMYLALSLIRNYTLLCVLYQARFVFHRFATRHWRQSLRGQEFGGTWAETSRFLLTPELVVDCPVPTVTAFDRALPRRRPVQCLLKINSASCRLQPSTPPNMGSVVQQTPVRPVPGIWPQTPAPRPALSAASSFQTPPRPPLVPSQSSASLVAATPAGTMTQTSMRQPEALEPAERAARAINESLSQESRFPEVDNYLTQGYSADYEIQSSTTWAPFQKAGTYRIPDEIFEQYSTLR